MNIERKKGIVGPWGLAMVFIGYGITINAVGIGASLGQGMTMTRGWIAMFFGFIILSILATVSGYMGFETRYPTSIVWRYIYGFFGGRIPSIIVGVSIVLWTFFDCWYVGAAMKGIFKSAPVLAFVIGELICLCFCLYGAIKGLAGLAKVATATIPIAIVLFIIVCVQEVIRGGGISNMMAYNPLADQKIGMGTGINIVVGHFICCTGLWGDLTCEANVKKAVNIAIPAGMLANIAVHFVGQFGVISLGAFGLDAVANALGGVIMIVLHVFTIVAVINTTPGSYHLVKTQLGDSIGHPLVWAIAGPVIGCCGAFLIEFVMSLGFISTWSTIVSAVMSPVVGVSLAEFFFGIKTQCPKEYMPPKWRKAPLFSLAVTFIVCVYCSFALTGMPIALIGSIGGFI
ncbi:MAG: hypothetical protein IJM69_07660, partial [Firmicutes bacterium]|nr:hypothetical protein [Bacillota bacterium]